MGMPAVPLLGIYGPDYWPSLPHVLITLPFERLWLPECAKSVLAGVDPRRVDACVCFFGHVPEAPSEKFISSATNEVNVMLHYWRFAQAASSWGTAELKSDLRCHAPLAEGAGELYQSLSDGGLPLGIDSTPAARSVVVHGGGGVSVSPNNCQFAMLAPAGGMIALMVVATAAPAPGTPPVVPWRSPGGVDVGGKSAMGGGRIEHPTSGIASVILLPRDAVSEASAMGVVAKSEQTAPAVLKGLAGLLAGGGADTSVSSVLLRTAASLSAPAP